MGDYTPKFEQRDGDARGFGHARLGTGGAIPVKNEKGQIVMQKVKVQRYMAGKAPAYARSESDSESGDEAPSKVEEHRDRRESRRDREERSREYRFDREVTEAQIIGKESSSDEDEERLEERRERARARRREMEEEESGRIDEDGDGSDDDMERRRRLMKERILKKEMDEMAIKEEVKEDWEEEEEEESEYSSSEEEEEDTLPRLKPIFVRKKDRITLMEAEKEQKRVDELKVEEERRAEEKKRESIRLVHDILKEEQEAEKRNLKKDEHDLECIKTDDESEELAYEEWKLREMKRLKRNREEREAAAKERAELERVHNMTEEERRAYIRANPKIITNKAEKGKYKFLQKYYHRGAFFLDEEDQVYTRDFNEATLDDKFDKTVLPKVMQVKDFGKASRSKWTHLTAEDTTEHQGAWFSATALNVNFANKSAAGMKQVFERPAAKKRKTTN
ncbi:hypothetical protein PMAYCL1PPCAC_23866 [Pristionchus mayeri]|uniref:Micro-fibrillar-associated protein 1 C-terminal domain-containing protein n=1 Tax=Pristionchus mayeri TaxID=1317129 RepID=A0AAN5I805_9BILA|nr:hypothetical protein PMAYCL1PPCAC_23866 [Pristionchus mayeri]